MSENNRRVERGHRSKVKPGGRRGERFSRIKRHTKSHSQHSPTPTFPHQVACSDHPVFTLEGKVGTPTRRHSSDLTSGRCFHVRPDKRELTSNPIAAFLPACPLFPARPPCGVMIDLPDADRGVLLPEPGRLCGSSKYGLGGDRTGLEISSGSGGGGGFRGILFVVYDVHDVGGEMQEKMHGLFFIS